MKKLFLFLITIFSICTGYTQSSTFDSAYTFLSSNIYDYKNPTFENKHNPFDYYFTERIMYERHIDSTSDLFIREFTFSSEGQDLIIISDGNNNINPSFSNNMIVCNQTNSTNKIYFILFSTVQTGLNHK